MMKAPRFQIRVVVAGALALGAPALAGVGCDRDALPGARSGQGGTSVGGGTEGTGNGAAGTGAGATTGAGGNPHGP